MDVVACSTFVGQELRFIDAERFAHSTARGLCIYDTTKGPREMMWRHEQGLSCFTADLDACSLIFAGQFSYDTLEMIKLDATAQSTLITNPCKCPITTLEVSRESEKLYGLSSAIDHKLIIWSLGKIPQVLISQKLDIICSKIAINPVDSHAAVVYGADGLRLVYLNEVFGNMSLQVTGANESKDSDVAFDVFSADIGFCVWLPHNRVLVVTSLFDVYEIRVESRIVKRLGKFVDPVVRPKHEVQLCATCAVLTINHLIVGTEDGCVCWYPLGTLLKESPEATGNFFQCPAQVARLHTGVCSLVVDPNRAQLVMGTVDGQIFKAAIDVEVPPEADRADQDEASPEHVIKLEYKNLRVESIGNDVSGGIVLCSKFGTMGVRKLSSKSKASVTFLTMGTHQGFLKFWRHSASAVDAGQGGHGIRRSTPRMMKEILSLRLKSQTPDGSGPAVCAIEMMPWKAHHLLVFLGTSNGMMEIWQLEAIEHDEDDVKEDGPMELESKLIEDDEGSCVLRVECAFQLKSKVFKSALSAFSAMTIDGDTRLVASSADDSLIYVFSAIRDGQLALGQVLSVIDFNASVPLCLTQTDDSVVAFGTARALIRYPASSSMLSSQADALHAIGDVHLFSLSPNSRLAVAVNASGRAFCFPMEGHVRPKYMEHPDLVCALAFAPNGEMFITGGVTGIIVVWKIDLESGDVFQANTVALHSSALTSLTFSPNSSNLFTSAADGSSFILAVGKLTSKHVTKAPVVSAHGSSGAEHEGGYVIGSHANEDMGVPLFEHMQMEQEKELKTAFKFKCMGISAAVQEIQHRLSILVKQNAERSELEQLGLEDFVVDLEKKAALEARNKDEVKALREKYTLRRKWLELLAARLKSCTWDTTLESSVLLKPFIGIVDVDPIEAEGVSSFSISRLTDREQIMLSKLKRLRALEMRCMKKTTELGNIRHIRGSAFFRCAWALTLKGCSPDVSWIVNDGQCWPLQKALEETTSAATPGAASSAGGAAAGAAASGGGGAKSAGPESDAAGNGGEDDEEGSLVSQEDYYDIDENELLNLIYAPETVRTIVQKRNQILFLKEVVHKIKERFNQIFLQLQKEKEDVVQFIGARNERIAVILEELHQSEKIWMPTWSNAEKKGSAIEVAPEEMMAEPYESEAAREARIREAEERALRQQSDEQQLERERALVDMMHGTLEIKRDVFAEALLLQRPPWMDTLTPAEMSDAQLKEYEAYQNKLRELQEEQAHYRKTLEQEMKKLKVEITESCKSFNDKLEALNRLKVLGNREVLAQEVYIVRISLSMVKADQLRAACKKNDSKLQEARKDRTEVKGRNEKINRSVEELKARIAAVQEEEKNLDKTFRRDLQNLCNNTFDQDSLKVFTALYRKRLYPRGGLSSSSLEDFGDQSEIDVSASASNNRMRRSNKDASSSRRANKNNSSVSRAGKGAKNRLKSSRNVSSSAMAGKDSTAAALGPMQQAAQALLNTETDNSMAIKEKDPYFEAIVGKQKAKKITEAVIPVINALSIELDCPEGFVVDQFSWSKLQELRNARIEKEIEAKLLIIEQAETRAKVAVLESEEAKLAAQVNDTRSSRDSLTTQLHGTETNLDLMVSLLQGQDEVDRDAVATEYPNALLFPVDVVSKYNARIKELGSEKIGILAKTKVFRRKINLISWEAKHQGLQAKHFEAYYTDLQLFRVTRDLQKVILEGENANNQKDRVEKVNHRKDFLQKDYLSKINQEMKTLLTLRRSVQEKEQESKHLENTITQLVAEVQQSENIKLSKVQASGGAGLASTVALKKMKKVVQRSKLVDLARVQAEEIEMLRQELDRMRQRTFPSFVKATKKRLMNAPF